MRIRFDRRTLQDMERLEEQVLNLDPAIQDYLWGEMTFACARRLAREAAAGPPFNDITGNLRHSIRPVRVDIRGDGGRVIPKGGALATMGGRNARQAHLIEWGTEQRVQHTTGRRTGKIEPRLVMTEVFETKQQPAVADGIKAGRRNFNRMVRAAANGGQGLTRRARRALAGG